MSVIMEKKFTVRSIIENEEGEPHERSESVVFGTLKISEEGYGISYSESSEGVTTKTFITVKDGEVRVKRLGGIESDFLFSQNVQNKSVYKIPPYAFDATVTAKHISYDIKEERGHLYVLYVLEIGGAKKGVELKITY